MNFIHRLKYYIFGLLIGSLMVYVILFRHRDEMPAWTPNDRVIQELRLAEKTIDEGVTIPFPDSLLNDRIKASSVSFSESDVRSGPCRVYQLHSESESMRFSICGGKATLLGYTER